VRTLLFTDVVDSTRVVERLGDARAAEIWAAHDRRGRALLVRHQGREIDRADGFFLLFDEPADAADYALGYHATLADLGLSARVGIHVGAVILRENVRMAPVTGPWETATPRRHPAKSGLPRPLPESGRSRHLSFKRAGDTDYQHATATMTTAQAPT